MSRRFAEVQEEALGVVNTLTVWSNDGLMWLPCLWHPDGGHTAIYCNLNSNLDMLVEQLAYGRRHGRIVLPAKPSGAETAERLFRFYGSVFLILDQCAADLADIWIAVDGGRSGQPTRAGKALTAPIRDPANHLWKHRRSKDATGRVMHRDHHHGPYAFADAASPELTAAVTAEGGLLVPSVLGALRALLDAVDYTDGLFADNPATKERVDSAFSTRSEMTAGW